jgi:hypothetical protein
MNATLTLATVSVLLAIVALLVERWIDKLQSRPLQVVIVAPVELQDGASIRQALNNIGNQIYAAGSLFVRSRRVQDGK